MEKKVTRVEVLPRLAPEFRVAAYARVSSEKDAMRHSLSAQVSYYSNLIQSHPGWQYAGVYADEPISGTKDSREEFQRLLADCRAGRINMVITKSISRFARNTVTLLKTIRELKDMGIDVFFEEHPTGSIIEGIVVKNSSVGKMDVDLPFNTFTLKFPAELNSRWGELMEKYPVGSSIPLEVTAYYPENHNLKFMPVVSLD